MSTIILTCEHCGQPFERQLRLFNSRMKNSKRIFCSLQCSNKRRTAEHQIIQMCLNCGEPFESHINKLEKHKFCSQSCSATFNNKNKTTGTRRSKIERFIEEQLTILFTDLEIVFNDKNIIGSELDIYFPSLKLAFELNGIFHYEPIFGETKLDRIQSNDKTKMIDCIKNGIDLCVIDISYIKRFSEQSSLRVLNTIIQIINERRSPEGI